MLSWNASVTGFSSICSVKCRANSSSLVSKVVDLNIYILQSPANKAPDKPIIVWAPLMVLK